MTEQNDGTETQDDGTYEFPEGIHPDLRLLISLANGEKMSMNSPVTVWVKGVQFSGLVVAAKEARIWFIKTWTDGLRNAAIGKAEGMTAEAKVAALEGIRGAVDDTGTHLLEQEEKAPHPKRFGFLSLKNARVWTIGSREPTRLEMVRIRLDQIDAFTLGEPS
ncbi:hypothetical protein WME73_38250 [Sorangium sp. So ce302]|uniref:hypothetical protein n=1 Tax=Sorangium sp. So ce302 TaxID=3133297 RepID=UPI003F6195A2